jgi:cytochrome P450
MTWRPSRWIQSSASPSNIFHETLYTPPRDTYLPWSDGPQNCPGVKFSQVEFVAVLAKLLYRHRLSVVRNEGENVEKMQERVRAVVEDCDIQMLLKMKDPDRVKVRCERVDA